MEAININLLPIEDALRQKKEGKFRLIQGISVFLLLTLLFLATIGFILRFLQNKDISKVESAANSAESEVAGFKDKEAALFILKNRLTAISQIIKEPGTQAEIYDLAVGKLSPSIGLASVGIDKNGNITQSLVMSDGLILDNLLDRYMEKALKIEIESLSRGRDGVYRVNLKIQTK